MKRAVLVAVVLLAGCGGGEEPPAPGDDAAGFESPVELATAFLESNGAEARTTSIVAERPGEAGPEATITITLDGIFDDSVQAVRYTLEAEQREGAWHLVSTRREQRCAPGRGHEDFSPEDCV